jgi:pSer/pThr/pTyr-binding forkhead associated (FHA) protein
MANSSNLPDDLSAESLSAASHTLLHGCSEMETMRAQLTQAASLLASLPAIPQEASLVFRRPGDSNAESVAIGVGVTIGRGEGCEVRFEGRQELSRRHFAVGVEGGFFIAEDLGSSNGTCIEGMAGKLSRRELRDGDLIRAGGIVFLFVRC